MDPIETLKDIRGLDYLSGELFFLIGEDRVIRDITGHLQEPLSDEIASTIGRRLEEVRIPLFQQIEPELLERAFSGEVVEFEWSTGKEKGSRILHTSLYPVNDGESGSDLILGRARDVTENRRLRMDLERNNRALSVINACNDLLLHSDNEEILLREICRTLVTEGGYPFVWIGWKEGSENETLRPVAWWGQMSLSGTPAPITDLHGMGYTCPVVQAVQNHAVENRESIEIHEGCPLWGEPPHLQGPVSLSAIPFILQDMSMGLMTVYSRDPERINGDEIDLLMRLASNLAQGISTIRLQRREDEMVADKLRRNRQESFTGHISEILLRAGENEATDAIGNALKHAALFFSVETSFLSLDGSVFQEIPDSYEGSSDFTLFTIDIWKDLSDRALAALRDLKGPLSLMDASFANGTDPRLTEITRSLQGKGIRGALLIPLYLRGLTAGFLGICSTGERNWREEEIQSLKLMGDLLINNASRREEELRIRKSEAKLRAAQQLAHLGSWDWDMIRNIATRSEEVYEIYGVSPQQYGPRYEDFIQRIHPDDREMVIQTIRNAIGREGQFTMEFRITHPFKGPRVIFQRGIVIQDHSGQPVRLVGAIQDITDWRDTQSNLKLFRDLLDQSGDEIFIADAETGRIVDVNRRACQALGYERDELLLLNAMDVSATIPDEEVWNRHVQNMRAMGTINVEGIHRRKDGSTFPIEANVHFATMGEKSFTIVFARDISKRKQAEEELRNNEKMLVVQSRLAAMGEMIGAIAHQWRQPLNLVSLMVQSIQDDYRTNQLNQPALKEYVDTAMQQVHHMSRTIDDFRNFFAPDKEKVTFCMRQQLQVTQQLLEPTLKHNAIELETIIAAEGQFLVMGYPNEFSQVLLNLIQNAKDVLEERSIGEPRIRIRLDTVGSAHRLTIQDNGGGIPEPLLEKIFDPYFTTKGPDRGTGIGLYMSKVIIEKHMHGSITARNDAEGALFTITLQGVEP